MLRWHLAGGDLFYEHKSNIHHVMSRNPKIHKIYLVLLQHVYDLCREGQHLAGFLLEARPLVLLVEVPTNDSTNKEDESDNT